QSASTPQTAAPARVETVASVPEVAPRLDFPTAPADVSLDFDAPLASDAAGFSGPEVVLPSADSPINSPNNASEEVRRHFEEFVDPIETPRSPISLETGAPVETPATTPDSDEPAAQTLEEAPLTEEEAQKLIVEDVRVSGLEMTTQQFNQIVKTRIGARFNRQRLEEDKRALLQTKQFVDVAISTSWRPDAPDKVVVNFDLTPRRMMRYILVVGNRKIAKNDILDELGIKPGETRMDPYEVENGRLRIVELYKSKEYPEPHVEILRGDRPEDVGVIYLVDEGRKQKVCATKFIGNTIASSARLKSLVSVKPGLLYFIGGNFSRARLDADVAKLTEYYRALGFFDARIDYDYQEGEGLGGLGKENAWVAVRFIIDEGPRYKIRNFLFEGNKVVSTAELEKLLKVKRGSHYNQTDIELDRIALRYKYQDLGYVRADVVPTQLFTDEPGVVDIRYAISEDHRYRVRDVIVDYVGTESRTMTSVVLNMLDVSPGELLNGKKIRMSENTLKQSGYFNDKPEEGQLPTIAVVPDESRSFRVRREDARPNVSVVKEARRFDEDGNEISPENAEKADAESADGKTYFNGRLRETDGARTTRGQEANPTKAAALRPVADDANGFASAYAAPSAYRAYAPSPRSASSDAAPVVRAQTRQIPTGFSNVTTQSSGVGDAFGSGYAGYRAYDDGSASDAPSQYADSSNYANYGAALATNDESSAPGFSDGVYGSVGQEVLEPVVPDEEIYDGDVLVKVQEGRTGMFQASIGVNSDYGLVGNVSFTERNFNMFRLPTSFWRLDGWKDAFRGGGQIFSAQASPGDEVQRYSVSWDVPYVFNTKYTFGVTALYGDHSFDDWFESRYGGELRFGRQWTPRFSTTANFGAYNVKIKDPSVDYVPDLIDVLGKNDMYTLGLTATYDVRNHPFTPSEGYLLKGTVEQVFGAYQFPRAHVDARYYKTLRKRFDGSGRWVLGLMSRAGWSGDDAPIYERYYGGGSQNLRGFEYREVTPRFANTHFGVGGRFEFYNTAELLIPVSGGDEFHLAFFVDAGTVAENIDDWGTFRVAPGFGFRFAIPMLGPAPLALDFTFPVVKDDSDITQVFSFGLGFAR
ncbi:MAG: BamA/TamA family outer membrane protein, partial [Thermoguttaceae bacterium]|nr:BamA/TamA family outer membrane protein [Thermoguttaceae bacterium]